MKKLVLSCLVIAIAIIVFSFVSRGNSQHKEVKSKSFSYQLFRYDGDPGDEDDYTKYSWVESAPTGCSGQGSVCYIEALRASENNESPDYLHPQFDVSGGFPDVDMDKVIDLVEKGTTR